MFPKRSETAKQEGERAAVGTQRPQSRGMWDLRFH